MRAKTKFLKMFYKLPDKARGELILKPWSDRPLSLSVICFEVRNETKLGKQCLIDLGYEDDI